MTFAETTLDELTTVLKNIAAALDAHSADMSEALDGVQDIAVIRAINVQRVAVTALGRNLAAAIGAIASHIADEEQLALLDGETETEGDGTV